MKKDLANFNLKNIQLTQLTSGTGFDSGCKYIGLVDRYCGTITTGARGAKAVGSLTSLASKSRNPKTFLSISRLLASEFCTLKNIMKEKASEATNVFCIIKSKLTSFFFKLSQSFSKLLYLIHIHIAANLVVAEIKK